MSMPAAGGSVTIAPGADAVLLTEYAGGPSDPLTLINESPYRLWIGADSSVGPTNGTPLEGFTALPWTSPGQVWAVADAAATGAITLVTSTDIGGWQASPVAIASEVAAKLLATGIPSVLLETTIADNDRLAPGASKSYDVSQFASIVIEAHSDALNPNQADLTVAQSHDSERLYMETHSRPVRVAVSGPTLTLTNNLVATDALVTIVGSNRAALERYDIRRNTAGGDFWDAVALAVVGPDNQIALNQQAPSTQMQGRAFATFRVDNNIDGAFRCNWADANTNHVITLCETSQMAASADGSTQFRTTELALPAAEFSISFLTYGGAGVGTNINPVARFVAA